jgi:hypothetical protein
MQIHIHKEGKTFGPYPLEQVRQYLKAGNFAGNDLACHDGANWIKLSLVPGIAPTKPKPVVKQVEQPAKVETKPAKKLLGIKLLIVGFFLGKKRSKDLTIVPQTKYSLCNVNISAPDKRIKSPLLYQLSNSALGFSFG